MKCRIFPCERRFSRFRGYEPMKKLNKLFLALAGISAVSAGLAVGLVGVANSKLSPADATTTTSIASSSSTRRVWIRPNFDSWYESSAVTALRAWGGTAGSETIYSTTSVYNTLNSLYYWYADMPVDVTGFQAVRLSPSDNSIWSYSANFEPDNSTQIVFINSYSGNTYGTIDSPLMTAELAAKMVEGYTTCSDSVINGYGVGNYIRDNIYNKMASDVKTTFETTSISDYSYDQYNANAETDKYTGLTKGSTTTAGSKYARIMALYTAAHPSGAAAVSTTSDSASTLVLGGIAGVAVLAAGGYFFVRKKKVD
jgi:LPXTG-motif cell wall-anchored protein